MIFGDAGINHEELAKAEHISNLQTKSRALTEKLDHVLRVQQMNHETEDELYDVFFPFSYNLGTIFC